MKKLVLGFVFLLAVSFGFVFAADGDVYWADMNGVEIVEADFGDTVELVATGVSSGSFEIFEEDILADDAIKTIDGVLENGKLVARWTIAQEDLDKTADFGNFKFSVNGDESGELSINALGDDSPMSIEILSPACGLDFDEGANVEVEVSAEDEDDLIEANISINGFKHSFSNGGVNHGSMAGSFSDTSDADFGMGSFSGMNASGGSVGLNKPPALLSTGTDKWETLAPMPTQRYALTSAAVDGKIYAIGGGTDGGGYSWTNVNEMYDPVTNTWSTKASMPTVRGGMAGSPVINNKIYVIGGRKWASNVYTYTANEVYDPATNTWSTKASMPTARAWAAQIALNGKIYIIGGWGANSGITNKNEMYDLATNTWSTKAPMPTAISECSGAAVLDKIYVYCAQSNGATTVHYEYEPSSEIWTSKSLPSTLYKSAPAMFVKNNKIYFIGNARSGVGLNQIYDPSTDLWDLSPANMPTPRTSYGYASTGDKFYILGGGPSTVNEGYTPLLFINPETSGSFISRSFDAMDVVIWDSIAWNNVTPAGTSLTLHTRTSDDNLTWSDWSLAHSSSPTSLDLSSRYLQYKVEMITSNGSISPELLDVAVGYMGSEEIDFSSSFILPGNLQIEVDAVNGRGERTRRISNIMVLDKDAGGYVEADYVAACITEPEDFSDIDDSIVNFDASTTRAIRVDGSGNLNRIFPGSSLLSWYWEFMPENVVREFVGSDDSIAYIFTAEFPIAGDNSASLRVELV